MFKMAGGNEINSKDELVPEELQSTIKKKRRLHSSSYRLNPMRKVYKLRISTDLKLIRTERTFTQ